MTRFKDLSLGVHRKSLENPSAQVTLKASGHTLFLKFNSNDVLTDASYLGPVDLWIAALCDLVQHKHLSDLLKLSWNNWDEHFKEDQLFWDLKTEKLEQVFFPAQELLRAGLDTYRGQEFIYQEQSALICRCFGVRESDVLAYVRTTNDPTPEGLAEATKAGMGCRSCVPQLSRILSMSAAPTQNRFFKDKSRAHWLLEIDYMLSCFPEASDWGMEVQSFQGSQVTVAFKKSVSQREEEEVATRLQDFLGAALDPDLAFFLIRA